MAPFNSALEFAEVEDVAQLSRPFQIALGAVVLFALVWMFALRAHVSNPSGPAPTSAPAPGTVVATTKDAGAAHRSSDPSSVHKTAVAAHKTVSHKTVSGAQRTSASVRKAVADPGKKTTSARHAASDPKQTVVVSHKTTTSVHKTVVVPRKTAAPPHKAVAPTHTTVVIPSSHSDSTARGRSDSSTSKPGKRTPEQAAVEHELAEGKTVMLVFWNPHSSVDREVRSQASALASGSKGTVVMHAALANQVNVFGSITEVVRVYQTPTILIVNRHGVVSTITGLTEVFALQQAVREAQHASR